MTLPTEGLALVFVGAKVRLVGLQARKDLNDRLALVTSKYGDEEPVRWGIELQDDTSSRASPPPTRLKVKAANLRVVDWCESVLNSVGNLQKRASLVKRAGRYRPGDVFVQAGEGAYEALVEVAQASPSTGLGSGVDAWVKYACLVQLAKLAACPLHRPAFLDLGEGGGIRVLCHYANIPVTEYDVSFPARKSLGDKTATPQPHQRLSKAFEQLVGRPYDVVHPKCVLAKAFAALTEHQSCCSPSPACNTGHVILQHRGAMRSLAQLSEETCWCVTSQRNLGITMKALVEEVVRGKGEREITLAIDHGLLDTLSKLIRAAKENEDSPCAESLARLLNLLHIHPSHPQNQVPSQ
jgi:hypothetical protein